METIIAIGVIGVLATGTAGLPDRANREWVDHTKRVCAASQDHNPDHDARRCILTDMEKRKAELLADIKRGGWKWTR